MSRLMMKLAVCIALLQCAHYALDRVSITTSTPVYTADGPIVPPPDCGDGGNLLKA
jgi:hypothetical protein